MGEEKSEIVGMKDMRRWWQNMKAFFMAMFAAGTLLMLTGLQVTKADETCSTERIPFGKFTILKAPTKQVGEEGDARWFRVDRRKICDEKISRLPFVSNEYDFPFIVFGIAISDRNYENRIKGLKSPDRLNVHGFQEYIYPRGPYYLSAKDEDSPKLFGLPVLITCGSFSSAYFGGKAPGRSCIIHHRLESGLKLEVHFLDFNWPIQTWDQLFKEIELVTRHVVCCVPE